MHVSIAKIPNGFTPADPETWAIHAKMKQGEVLHNDKFSKMRNPRFHRKFFALLNLAFEYWEPGEISSKHGVPEKNFERFREDLTILAGFWKNVIRIDGSSCIEAKSISFAKMDELEFETVYNAVLNQILKRINVLNKMSADQVNALVDRVLEFG